MLLFLACCALFAIGMTSLDVALFVNAMLGPPRPVNA